MIAVGCVLAAYFYFLYIFLILYHDFSPHACEKKEKMVYSILNEYPMIGGYK